MVQSLSLSVPLTQIKVGELLHIKSLDGPDNQRKRLYELGFVPGARVEVLRRRGDTVVVRVGTARLAVTGEMAKTILAG